MGLWRTREGQTVKSNRTALPTFLATTVLMALVLTINVGCRSTKNLNLGAASPRETMEAALGEVPDNVQHKAHETNSSSTPIQLAAWQGVLDESNDLSKDGADSKEADDELSPDQAKDSHLHSAPTLAIEQSLNNAEPLSVEACVQIALASHPKIVAARFRVQAAQNRVPQARALEDPMLDNMFFPIPGNSLQTAGGRMQNTIGLSQQIPWPEKLKARAAVACQEVHIAQAEVNSTELEIAEAVRLAYYEVWFADRGTEILLANQKLVADLIRIAEARYKTGGSQQDVLNAEIERERLSQQLLDLASSRAAAEAELAAYLQQPQTFALKTDDSLSIDELPTRLDLLIASAEQCNPELRGLGSQIQRDVQKQRLANLQRYSDFQVGTQYGFMTRDRALSPVADGTDNISFSIGMTLPIYRSKINGSINEAVANRASTVRIRQSEQLTIEGRLRRLLAEVDAIDQQRTLYKERVIPRAQQALEIALSEYTVGKTTFVQLTDNYTELLMYQLQVTKLESTLAAKLAQLERTVGCPT